MFNHLATVLALAALCHAAPPKIKNNFGHGKHPGHRGFNRMFIFGDSYSRTGFDVNGTQPSSTNPLGNPAYPGNTSSNGPNWVDFLTTTWNRSLVETVNLAYSGATVDFALIPPSAPTMLSVKEQIDTEYIPVYSSHQSTFQWQPRDTLFAIFIGINDLNNAYRWTNKSEVYPKVISEYAGLVDQLYHTGARNFLFLNVPPIDRAPTTTEAGGTAPSMLKSDISAWNANVSGIARNLSHTYHDVATFVFDTNAIYTQVLDDPFSHPSTSAYKDTVDYCESYENGTPSWYTKSDNCTYAVDEYFWLNYLHPTFRMHNLTAKEISYQLAVPRHWW